MNGPFSYVLQMDDGEHLYLFRSPCFFQLRNYLIDLRTQLKENPGSYYKFEEGDITRLLDELRRLKSLAFAQAYSGKQKGFGNVDHQGD